VKIPPKKETILSADVWIAGIAIATHLGCRKPREGFEIAIRKYAQQLAANDPSFVAVWDDVKKRHETS